MRGNLIAALGHLYDAYKAEHSKAPNLVYISKDYHERLVRDVDDIREVFGQKRAGVANRYRGIPVVIHHGEKVLKVE
jgi:hypothetical protein